MAEQADIVYKDFDTIVAELTAAFQARVPDVVITRDSVARILIEAWGSSLEGLYLAAQLLHDDLFIQTAQAVSLLRYGEQYGRPLKAGTRATGSLLVSGDAGVTIPLGAQFGAPRISEDALLFNTTASATIPNPGVPTAPTVADGGAGALAAGLYEYAVSFVTAAGETLIGAVSSVLNLAASKQVSLTNIPTGGPGTTKRRIYRRFNGGSWLRVTEIANNTATTHTDNNTTPAGTPLAVSTAQQVSVTAESDDVGVDYNVVTGSITEVVDTLDVVGITGVTNPAGFDGGSDDEDIEELRTAVLNHVRAPGTGSPSDLKSWAESVEGVEEATVFKNDNLGVAQNGHTTVRITGPGGTVPSGAVIAEVLALLEGLDLANVIIHVTSFTAIARNVTVTITVASGYVLADITTSVQNAIKEYINSVPVAGTLYVAGIVDAVFGLPGVATVVVNSPAVDQTHAATEKPVPGTITVN